MLLGATSRPSLTPAVLVLTLAVLVVAYAYTLLTRPIAPDHVRELDPGQWGFPGWYGRSPSPYDPADDGEVCEQPEEVLLFIDLPRNSSAVRYAIQLADTLRASDKVRVDVVSSFAWNATHGGMGDVAARCRETVWRVGQDVRDWEGACPASTVISEIIAPAPVIDPRANVCRTSSSAAERTGHFDAQITLASQPYHLLAPDATYESLAASFGDEWEMGLLAHVLPFADPGMFYPTRLVSNHKAVTYFPRRETDRKTWPKTGRFSLHRPNAREPTGDRPGVDALDAKSNFRRFWTKTGDILADDLRFAGVCLFEGWEDGILDERVAQAMLSGCVVATVPPEVEQSAILPLIIPLARPTTAPGAPVPSQAELPTAQLDAALARLTTAELKSKALASFVFARERFSAQAGLADRLRVLDRWKAGGRGYLFPHAFRQTCDSPGGAAWCT